MTFPQTGEMVKSTINFDTISSSTHQDDIHTHMHTIDEDLEDLEASLRTLPPDILADVAAE